MKNNKLILLVFIFFSLFILFGCNKPKDKKEPKEEENKYVDYTDDESKNKFYNQDTLYLVTGQKSDVPLLLLGKVKGKIKLISRDESIISITNENELNAIKAGDVIIDVEVDEEYYGSLKYHVFEIDELDYNVSDEVINNISQKFDGYNPNEVTVKVSLSYSKVRYETTTKMRLDPLYYEETNIVNPEIDRTIVKKENDKYFSYDLSRFDNKAKRTYLEEFDISTLLHENDAYLDIIETESQKIEITEVSENKYKIRFRLSDYRELFNGLGLDELFYLANETIVTYDLVFYDNRLDVNMNLCVYFVSNGNLVDSNISFNIKMDFSPITEFDLTGYVMSQPQCIEEITEETVLDIVEIDACSSEFLYGYLESGSYVLEPKNYIQGIDILKYEIYDLNENKLNTNPDFYDVRLMNSIMIIEKSGYYYIKLRWSLSQEEEIIFKKLDYSINNKTEELKISTGTLAGSYDYRKFVYYSTNENEAIKITNTSTSQLCVYVKNGSYYNPYLGFAKIDKNKSLYINPDYYYDCYIYIVSVNIINRDFKADYEAKYSFDYEIVVNENGIDENNPDILSTTYGNEYFIGCGYGPRYVLIKVEKAGKYDFYEYENGYEYGYYVHIGDKMGQQIYLEPGEYVIRLSGTNKELRIIKLRYEYVGKY